MFALCLKRDLLFLILVLPHACAAVSSGDTGGTGGWRLPSCLLVRDTATPAFPLADATPSPPLSGRSPGPLLYNWTTVKHEIQTLATTSHDNGLFSPTDELTTHQLTPP